MRSCSHSFNTYLLNTYYVPDTGLCLRERAIMNTDKVSGYILVKGNRKKKQLLFYIGWLGKASLIRWNLNIDLKEERGKVTWINEEHSRQRQQQVQTPWGRTMLAVVRRRVWPECTVLRENEVGELEEGKLIDRPCRSCLDCFYRVRWNVVWTEEWLNLPFSLKRLFCLLSGNR